MPLQPDNLNPEVTRFLDELQHPLRAEIEQLRLLVLRTTTSLSEHIKWNGPNYSLGQEDRITMKIHPPKSIQLVFHRGAKAQEQPKEKLIGDPCGILTWKGNDRAFATFRNSDEIIQHSKSLASLISAWLEATRPAAVGRNET